MNQDIKSLKLQIFTKIFDTRINKTFSIKELIKYIQSDLVLKSKTLKYKELLKTAPGKAKTLKYKEFKEISLIQYRSKKDLNSFNKAYGLIVDIDKKDNLQIDLKVLYNKIKQDNIFNIGFISMSGGIKLIRFFDKPIINIELLKGLRSVYFRALENKYKIKIDYLAYKHTLLSNSNELFYNFNNTLKTDYWINEYKKDIAKKEIIRLENINLVAPGGAPANLIEACKYLSNVKLSYQDWIKCCFGLANSFGAGGFKYWSIICNNPFYNKDKHRIENNRIWNNAINKAQGQSDFRAIIKIAINYGFNPGGIK
jgi:hypothetical protein